ncbi:unnamed protein product [Durusdinium trenchii]|uniref:Uncharacterized protein n=2 Tax=Durusdinium trenchii TaxID=1381693 RepID=A0ABP0IBG6_9DINO
MLPPRSLNWPELYDQRPEIYRLLAELPNDSRYQAWTEFAWTLTSEAARDRPPRSLGLLVEAPAHIEPLRVLEVCSDSRASEKNAEHYSLGLSVEHGKWCLKPGDWIVAVNRKTDRKTMTQVLQGHGQLRVAVVRFLTREDLQEPTPTSREDGPLSPPEPQAPQAGNSNVPYAEMRVIEDYDAGQEPIQGYLQLRRGDLIHIQTGTNQPAEESNSRRCEYVWGWPNHLEHNNENGGWLPVECISIP